MHRRPVQTDDLMSVCFEVSPRRTGEDVAEQDARQVRRARVLVAARLKFCGLEPLVDDVTLIVSELVTNAIVHSGSTQVTVTFAVVDSVLTISVHDEKQSVPEIRIAGRDAETGRGLFLVEHITTARGGVWGTSNAGATTWCSLPTAAGRPS
ncbi:ATP-binding protein [Streptomyces sp. NBC_00638]|uniref:ATP-binding protein n=1 Tax=Streptomyces sp. NBC_00638 TaxID=2975794 RepID=UPI002254F1BD|nr:ATP-binding protein [Streptomyces sp. NBC_00638]MCX5008651.1 ATP-binding protein [Streptomyces sp. NBC_00638]